MTALEINPRATIEWHPIDDHGTHALVVDDFLADPHALRSIALGLAFQVPTAPDRYPGLKSYLALPGASALKSWIVERVLGRSFPDGRSQSLVTDDFDDYGGFSVFACDREYPLDLEDQHTDDVAWLAGVLHLSSVVDGRGTAMWEHRPTGLQQWISVDPAHLVAIERMLGVQLGAQIARANERVPGLAAADVPKLLRAPVSGARRSFSKQEDATWRLTAFVPARWNRLVVYPTWQIHSVVDESSIEWPTIENMRLTYNVMIEYPVAREKTRSRAPYPRAFYRHVAGLR